jgi:hypothetical protein
MRMNLTIWLSLVLLLLTVAVPAQTGTARDGDIREAFTAVALSAGGPRTGPVATNLEIVIDRWSTESERRRMFQAIGKGTGRGTGDAAKSAAGWLDSDARTAPL